MEIVNNLFDFIEKYSQENPMKLRLKRFDSYYFADSAETVTYIERYPLYCDVAKYNFNVLQKNNIRVICSDSLKFVFECNVKFDAFYIDPARRNS